jgi:hypothetical protein
VKRVDAKSNIIAAGLTPVGARPMEAAVVPIVTAGCEVNIDAKSTTVTVAKHNTSGHSTSALLTSSAA